MAQVNSSPKPQVKWTLRGGGLTLLSGTVNADSTATVSVPCNIFMYFIDEFRYISNSSTYDLHNKLSAGIHDKVLNKIINFAPLSSASSSATERIKFSILDGFTTPTIDFPFIDYNNNNNIYSIYVHDEKYLSMTLNNGIFTLINNHSTRKYIYNIYYLKLA